MFFAPAVIFVVVVFGWLGYEVYSVVRRRRAALLEGVRVNPGDFVRARLNQTAPKQLKLNRQVEVAQTHVTEAEQKVAETAKELPGDPPPRKLLIVILAFSGLWLVAFTVQYLLDFRIAMAITGNVGSAALTSLAFSGLLSATTLAGALLWVKRSTVSPRLLRLGLVVAAGIFVAILSVVIVLAPKRAELDYADRIDTAKQSILMFAEDGDTTARSLEEARLARLEKQRDQAATFYQATAVIAGVLEGGSSLAIPSGYLLLSYYRAQVLVRRRRGKLTKARNQVASSRERLAAQMSRLLERAGVTQDRLGPLLGGAGGRTPHGAAPAAPEIDRSPAALPPTARPASRRQPTDPPERPPPRRAPMSPQGSGPQEGPRRDGPNTGPDPSFDQA